ncbi:MAG: hypothetical protein Kow0029_22070 [Candidatus Rifleibacteriota bacterium]
MTLAMIMDHILHSAISETFEGLVFEEVVLDSVAEADLSRNFEGSWWTKIEIFEPFHAEMVMVVKKELMVQYTGALLGMLDDEMPDKKQVLDNLGELMNTICGRVMALMLPPRKKFRLGLPELGDNILPDLNGEFNSVNFLVGDDLVYFLVPRRFWEENFLNEVASS